MNSPNPPVPDGDEISDGKAEGSNYGSDCDDDYDDDYEYEPDEETDNDYDSSVDFKEERGYGVKALEGILKEEEEEESSDVEAERFRAKVGDYDSNYILSDDEENGKVDHKIWVRYWRQIRKSRGFDIKDFPGVCELTGFVPVDIEKSSRNLTRV